ncbi:MAG: hypothetical protein JJT82_08315 [Legionellaceae bacterium]|nr:hypothetical protein [Legionellaceae bacterium]
MGFECKSFSDLKEAYARELKGYLDTKKVDDISKIPNPKRRQEWASVGAMITIIESGVASKTCAASQKHIILTGYLLYLSSQITSTIYSATTQGALLKIAGVEDNKPDDADKLQLYKALQGFFQKSVYKYSPTSADWEKSAEPLLAATSAEYLRDFLQKFNAEVDALNSKNKQSKLATLGMFAAPGAEKTDSQTANTHAFAGQ